MKPTHLLLAGILAGALGVSSAAAQARPSAHASRVAKVQVRHTHLGSILVSSSGFTLYEFTRDRAGQNSCVKVKGCAEAWPALVTSGKPAAGPGVQSSMLSWTRLPNGSKQATYGGHPLYLYAGDSGPGETSYVGEKAFGGFWYALSASAHTVK